MLMVALIVVCLVAREAAEHELRKTLVAAVREHCESCTFSIAEVRAFRAPGETLELRGVRYDSRGTTGDWIQAYIPRLRIELALGESLRRRVLSIERLVLESPRVRLVERAGPTRLARERSEEGRKGGPPLMRVGAIEIAEGSFTYQDSDVTSGPPGIFATIRVLKIAAHISELGYMPELVGGAVTADARATLEHSGQVTLRLRAPLAAPVNVALKLSVEGQNLEELDRYFLPKLGIRVQGNVTRVAADIQLKRTTLTGQVVASYDGLNVDFYRSTDRSDFKKIIEQAMSNLELHEQVEHPEQKVVAANQRPTEPVVGFVFRGMEDAVLKIAG